MCVRVLFESVCRKFYSQFGWTICNGSIFLESTEFKRGLGLTVPIFAHGCTWKPTFASSPGRGSDPRHPPKAQTFAVVSGFEQEGPDKCSRENLVPRDWGRLVHLLYSYYITLLCVHCTGNGIDFCTGGLCYQVFPWGKRGIYLTQYWAWNLAAVKPQAGQFLFLSKCVSYVFENFSRLVWRRYKDLLFRVKETIKILFSEKDSLK